MLATDGLAAPMFVPGRRSVEDAVRSGGALPASIVDPVTRSVLAVLGETVTNSVVTGRPEPIAPGSLGHWHEAEADAS